ncbi:ADP-ribosylglycohydrolase family protein [Novosphingobium aquimarinum]|uniref:ADP-ribosylglycohydrolase family protein n=1 Tax=Novosphingobium aquimarinum TaxID=2682494 RepID=UPI0018DB1744|nr:ADP-ribosylglycohydrolase family protein [Novosphingobium aquimarinum]
MTQPIRTSHSHPLQIATLTTPVGGRIGVTFCPGKTQASAMSGQWSRDLATDLDAVHDWGACVVVTLIEEHELAALQVSDMGEAVAARHMDWYHLPIRDVTAPGKAFEAAWASAGAELRHRLACGFDVLIHCKGGLGRAGTVAARLLVELGEEPDEVIRKLRQTRPGAIETREQERHVRACRPVAPSIRDTSASAIRDRAMGALLGLAVGDAVGTTLEFRARDSYPLLTDMIGGGPFRLAPGEWTDDTAMALALADSLCDIDDLDEADLMRRFVSWRDEGTYSHNQRCFDIGTTTSAALSRFRHSGDPVAGSTDPASAGNGSLMRLAPVAIRFHRDRTKLVDVAARQSRTTHAAPEAVEACVAWAQMLADAIDGRPLGEILRTCPEGLSGHIEAICRGSWRGKARHEVQASGYVAHSLEASLWSIGCSGTFQQAILTAANLGEDADTTAAITGQLAGAAWGASAIPGEWRERLAWKARIEAMAMGLLEDTGM